MGNPAPWFLAALRRGLNVVTEVVWNQEPEQMTTVLRRRGPAVELLVVAVAGSQRTMQLQGDWVQLLRG